MKIEKSTVTKILITGADRLDPITVYTENYVLGKGKITIECYGRSWSSYWGSMSNLTIEQFFCACNEDYIAKNFSQIQANITDGDCIEEAAFKKIISMRRKHDIDRDEARELWNRVDSECFSDDGWSSPQLMQEIFGDEWWHCLPTKPNPDYQYLCRIIRVVQEAL